jgi:hypothetical protein
MESWSAPTLPEIADFHWASQGCAEGGLNLGTEIVDVYKQRDGDGDDNEYGDDNAGNFEGGFHNNTS